MPLSDDLNALAQRYAAAEAFLSHPHLHMLPAGRTGWTPAGHLWHTELVSMGALTGIARILGGRGEAAPPAPEAIAFLQQGTFPSGRQAPASVSPPAEGVDAEALHARMVRNAAAFARLDVDAVQAAAGTLPHPVLGPLTPALWVRFNQIHAAHHDRLAQALLDAARA